jgi:hypothetical protein
MSILSPYVFEVLRCYLRSQSFVLRCFFGEAHRLLRMADRERAQLLMGCDKGDLYSANEDGRTLVEFLRNRFRTSRSYQFPRSMCFMNLFILASQ